MTDSLFKHDTCQKYCEDKLHKWGYTPVSQDKYGTYFERRGIRVYVDGWGIFVFNLLGKRGWTRVAGYCWANVPWDNLK